MTEAGETNVRVAVRFRPMNDREKALNDTNCIHINNNQVALNANVAGNEDKNFAFDFVFDENCLQSEVWEAIGDPILSKAFSGYNGTIFAYGQTGSGKTWSMQGGSSENLRGIIPRMTASVFDRIEAEKAKHPTMQFLVTASYFELYNEVIFDLLDSTDRRKRPKGGLEIKEHPVLGVYVKNLQEVVVESSSKMQSMIDQGMGNRTTASTQMNAESSRSHSVFTFKLHQKDPQDESKNLFAKVNLVDLAGSERQKSTGATGATLKEGANINKSLSALGNVINALVEQSKGKKGVFIPYRNSKLTRVLQESLGGNSITIMVAAMSKALSSADETLSTLKYADRAKAIKVKAIKNDESSQVARLNEEIRLLKEKLMNQEGGSSSTSTRPEMDMSEIEERHRQQLKDLEDAMKSTWEEKARISEGHEAERLRLEAEQREAARQLSRQVQEKWQVIEDKKDIDLSVSHVKESSKSYLPEAVSVITSWQSRLRAFLKLETELAELDTVVNVYRSSLSKDEKAIMRSLTGGGESDSPIRRTDSNAMNSDVSATVDMSVISVWKQLKERFKVFAVEVSRWMTMQDAVLAAICDLKNSIMSEMETLNSIQPESNSDRVLDQFSEISRGFDIISRQLIEKDIELHNNASQSRHSCMNFRDTASRMLSAIQECDRALDIGLELIEEDKNLKKKSSLKDEIRDMSVILQDYINSDVEETKQHANGSIAAMPEPQDAFAATLPNGYSIDASSGDISVTVLALSQVLDWSELLKKNAPEKLLKRPPVRFIFDVLKTLSEKCGLVVSPNSYPSWENVSSTRESKLSFVETAIHEICRSVNKAPPVEAEAVIAGEKSDRVNILLQYAAVGAYNTHLISMRNANSSLSSSLHLIHAASMSGELKAAEEGSKVLHLMSSAITVVVNTLEFLSFCRNETRRRKEESMKKLMDGLADEKRQLEERLIKEKDIMKSESLGLSEQLAASLRKLQETESVLSAESTMRMQLQELVERLEVEKRDLQNRLQSQFEENDTLRTSLVTLQTKSDRECVLLENLRKKFEDQDILLSDLRTEKDKLMSEKLIVEDEKEELVNQVTVLTEERDAARNNEEELFETLRERSNDLEKLQESYVDMTDRCNDYQDELSDLREKIESLEELLLVARSKPAVTSMSVSRSEATFSPRAATGRSAKVELKNNRSDAPDQPNGHNKSPVSQSTPLLESPKHMTKSVELLVSADDSNLNKTPPAALPKSPSSDAQLGHAQSIATELVDEKDYADAEFYEDDYGDDFTD